MTEFKLNTYFLCDLSDSALLICNNVITLYYRITGTSEIRYFHSTIQEHNTKRSIAANSSETREDS